MTRKSQQLTLEALEDRTLLSTCHVTRLGDFGAGATLGGIGRGDLRYCITQANNNPGPDMIDFKVTGTILLNTALPDIDGDLTIVGPGADKLAIDAQQKARVFYIEESVTVEMSGIRVTGGSVPTASAGGGIYNEGNLTLENCLITGNDVVGYISGGKGGGIYNEGTLELSNTSVTGNSILGTVNVSGGGIYNDTGASLLVNESLISHNVLGLSFSSHAVGAGIWNNGQATIIQSTISFNAANKTGNTLSGWGGGIYNHTQGVLLVDSSVISNNQAAGDYYGFGGGISNGFDQYDGGEVTIVNTTITDNSVFTSGGQYGWAQGGGISHNPGGTMIVSHSTIANNHSSGGQGTFDALGGGIGGSHIDHAPGLLYLSNSIVAGNDAESGAKDLHGSVISSGYNLFSDSSGGSGYAPTDILDVDPMLGPLQDNGGLTWTMALLPGSPAIDAGDPNPTDPPQWDQRGPGFPRIVNGRLDIGAFEVQATEAPGTPSHFAVLITADLEFKLEDLT